MKHLLIITFFCLVAFPIFATGHHITPNSGLSYIRSDNLSGDIVAPGDTIYIDNGVTISMVELHGFAGSPTQPIVICNYGGQAIIGNPAMGSLADPSKGVRLIDCAYIKIVGTGTLYGLRIQNYPTGLATLGAFGISVSGRSHNLEFDSLEICYTSLGIQIQQDPSCNTLENAPYHVYDSCSIHHCYIHNNWNQGLYLGNTNPDNSPPPQSAHPTVLPRATPGCNVIYSGSVTFRGAPFNDCTILGVNKVDSFLTTSYFSVSGGSNQSDHFYNTSNAVWDGTNTVIHCLNDYAPINSAIENVTIYRVFFYEPARTGNWKIYNNRIDSNGRPGIQVSGASKGHSAIYNNWVGHSGLNGTYSQGCNIIVGSYGNCDIYNNVCIGSLQQGIIYMGGGGQDTINYIRDNIVDSAGVFRFANITQSPYRYDTISYSWSTDTVDVSILVNIPAQKYSGKARIYLENNQCGISSSRIHGYGNDHADIRIADYGGRMVTASTLNRVCGNTNFNGATGASKVVQETTPLYYMITGCDLPTINRLRVLSLKRIKVQ